MGRSKRIIHLCAAHYPVIAASYCCIRQARCESPIHRANATDETRHSPGDAAIARRLHKDAAHAAFDLNAGQNCLDQGASGDRQRFGDCQRTSGDRRSWVSSNAFRLALKQLMNAAFTISRRRLRPSTDASRGPDRRSATASARSRRSARHPPRAPEPVQESAGHFVAHVLGSQWRLRRADKAG